MEQIMEIMEKNDGKYFIKIRPWVGSNHQPSGDREIFFFLYLNDVLSQIKFRLFYRSFATINTYVT
jgi:hypothetical protein